MNIFILDNDINKCARYHCDQHVIKMILESTQILCSALTLKGYKTPYKLTHSKHPCVLWAADSFDNFLWLRSLAYALNKEYRYRYDKSADHKSIEVINMLADMSYAGHGKTPFSQAMPDKYRNDDDPVTAYRNYYIGEKLHFATWTKRKPPRWINFHH